MPVQRIVVSITSGSGPRHTYNGCAWKYEPFSNFLGSIKVMTPPFAPRYISMSARVDLHGKVDEYHALFQSESQNPYEVV